jgi:predicted ABC-type ATPase
LSEDPVINISRVRNKVSKEEYDVSGKKIELRYHKALENLEKALKLTCRTYIFNHLGKEQILSAEIYQGKL